METDIATKIVRAVALLACIALLAWMVQSCKTISAPQVVEHVRTEYVHDTLATRDSVYVSRNVYTRGDTVHHFDTVHTIRYRDKVVESVTHDSVPYIVEVPKYIRQRSGYDRFVSWGFWLLVLALGLYTAARILIKIYLKR